jgi:hypothetical protein
VIALASFLFGLGLIVLALQIERNSDDTEDAAENPVKQEQKKKAQPAWNIALGNVVVVAPDLGFAVKALKGGQVEESRIVARLESQLQGLREFYRQEGDKETNLMGGLLLQLTVTPAGEVTHVKELLSRIPDGEFKRAVLREVLNWTFPDMLADTTTINCPLLFVREGMDITTVVQWEKTVGPLGDKPLVARGNPQTGQQTHGSEVRRADAVIKTPGGQQLELKSLAKPYQIKHSTTIRKEANFNSPAVGKYTSGTRVTVISTRGDWLEVRADDANQSGFVRKEFVTAVELAHKK